MARDADLSYGKLEPYAAAQMLNCLTGGRAVVCCRPTSGRLTGGPHNGPRSSSRLLCYTCYTSVTEIQKKRNPQLQVFCYKVLIRVPGGSGSGAEREKLIMTLTSREWEVATLVAKGLSNKEIARHLDACEGTVKIHLHNIYEKLAVKNRTVLALMTQRVIESGSSEDRKGGAALAEAVAAV
jgi:DNA-binding CsgD family transcriptional regulator